jgi:hypothetical protein
VGTLVSFELVLGLFLSIRISTGVMKINRPSSALSRSQAGAHIAVLFPCLLNLIPTQTPQRPRICHATLLDSAADFFLESFFANLVMPVVYVCSNVSIKDLPIAS